MEEIEKNKNLWDMPELHEARMIVSLETAPQSSKYRQVMLTPEQFKRLSDLIFDMFKEGEIMAIEVSDNEPYRLPSEMRTVWYKKDGEQKI